MSISLIIVFALIWVGVTGVYALSNVVLGIMLSLVVCFFIRDSIRAKDRTLNNHIAILPAISLGVLLIVELFKSAMRVAFLVISPNMKAKIKPGIFAYPLTVTSERDITLLANLITLTPGTLSIDVSDDKKTLYIHALEMGDKAEMIASIRTGFEAKILRLSKS